MKKKLQARLTGALSISIWVCLLPIGNKNLCPNMFVWSCRQHLRHGDSHDQGKEQVLAESHHDTRDSGSEVSRVANRGYTVHHG